MTVEECVCGLPAPWCVLYALNVGRNCRLFGHHYFSSYGIGCLIVCQQGLLSHPLLPLGIEYRFVDRMTHCSDQLLRVVVSLDCLPQIDHIGVEFFRLSADLIFDWDVDAL